MDITKALKPENLIYEGKSKSVYNISEGKYAGKYGFLFTDKATGYMEDGKPVFDPGYDNVVGEIPGKGEIVCKFATYFFKLLKEKKISSHYIDTIDENVMIVEPAIPISMPAGAPEFEGAIPLQNLEWTFRNNATGSFWRRYAFVRPGKNLKGVVEAWTKGKSDILITYEALEASGVMTKKEINYADLLVKDIASIVSKEFASKGLHVIDGKFELGRLEQDGRITLIDEISPDVLRVCNGYVPDKDGNCMSYKECIETKFLDGKRKIKGKSQLTASELEKIFLD
ncbi:MAG: hypothetical protein ISS82_05385 [Nanoarchaeota archaeon]|nr:hypothetical protein [Nanoarchaeota archaeon]